MKKTIYIVLILFIVLLLAGCKVKNKQIITKCSMTDSQPNSGYKTKTNYEIYSTDNIVDKVILNQDIDTDNKQLVDNLKKSIEDTYKSNNSRYGGYSLEIEVKDNKILYTGTIDFNKMDLDKFIKDNVAFKDYVDEENRVTLIGIKKMYSINEADCQ